MTPLKIGWIDAIYEIVFMPTIISHNNIILITNLIYL